MEHKPSKGQTPTPDLQGALAALTRAAERARQSALLHGTDLVVFIDGKIEFVDPKTNQIKKRSA
jgi:hypothetical protein